MVDSVDYFVIKVSFEGTAVVVGRYGTFNEADTVAGDLNEVTSIDGVRVELWSNRIARRYGMPIERVRVEKLLASMREVETAIKRRDVTIYEASKSMYQLNQLLLKVLKND